MDTRTLFQLSADMAAIEDALWENGGELTDELAVALQETEQSLTKKIDGYISLLQSLASQKAMMKAQKERFAKMEKIADNAEKRIKEHLNFNMETFGIQKLEGETGKATRTKSTSTEVNEELLLAPHLFALGEFTKNLPPYITVDLKVNKTAIKDFYKETGLLPEGVQFVENYSLRIR